MHALDLLLALALQVTTPVAKDGPALTALLNEFLAGASRNDAAAPMIVSGPTT